MNCEKNLRREVSSERRVDEMSEENKKYLIANCDKVTITQYEGRWLHWVHSPGL